MKHLEEEIQELKRQKNVLLLAHYYTLPEVQEVADFVGDSLALSQKAAVTDADVILFAGVQFMAETAKILNPGKRVLVPDMTAGCSLADSCGAAALKAFMDRHPGHKVFSYINCSAAVKALSHMIVTSGNALHIIRRQPAGMKIIFAPDRNLGGYINRMTGRNMLLWDGACAVHDAYRAEAVDKAREKYPQAPVIAHPECRKDLLDKADFVGSTAAMLHYVDKNSSSDFIVATESGILHELRKRNPDRHFHTLFDNAVPHDCMDMKKNSLENICRALRTGQPELLMDEALMEKARLPIQRMLEQS